MITVTSKRGTVAKLINHDPRRTEDDGTCTVQINGQPKRVKTSAIGSWECDDIFVGKTVNLNCGGCGTVLEIDTADIDIAVRVGDIDGHLEGMICGWFGVLEIK